MIRIILPLAVVFLFRSTANAQIGCTLEQSKARYGSTSDIEHTPDGTLSARFLEATDGSTGGDFAIYASFAADGKCDCISYVVREGHDSRMTPKQAETLLRLNANGYIWTRTDTTPKEVDYSAHMDGKIAYQAFYSQGKKELMIATAEWWQTHQ
jgi:hypothetical protein